MLVSPVRLWASAPFLNFALVLAIEFWYFPAIVMARSTPTLALDAANRPPLARREPWRFWPHLALFAATVLLVNGLFGERGLMDTIRANRAAAAAARDLE